MTAKSLRYTIDIPLPDADIFATARAILEVQDLMTRIENDVMTSIPDAVITRSETGDPAAAPKVRKARTSTADQSTTQGS